MEKKHPLTRLVRLAFILFSATALAGGLWMTFRGKPAAPSWILAGLTALISFLLTYVPDYLGYRDIMMVPASLKLSFILFIFLAMFLGNLLNFYQRFFWWDTMLHFASGALFALAGLSLLVSMIREPDLIRQINPRVFFLFSFVFSLACGAVWEVFEFASDSFLGMNMQRWQSDMTPLQWEALRLVSNRSNPGLIDTMKDMMAGGLGALLASLLVLPSIRRASHYPGVDLTARQLEDQLRFLADQPKEAGD